MSELSVSDQNAKILEVELSAAKLQIETGERLTAQSSDSNITVKQDKEVLQIKEKKHNWFRNGNQSKVVVSIPEDMEFDKVLIHTGAGQVDVDTLTARILDLDLGAGEVKMNSIVSTEKADIDGGTGKLTILSSSFHNLKLDMGIGESEICGQLTGDTKVDIGIGKLFLDVLGAKSDYTIDADKGIGEFTIDGENIGDEKVGNGENNLRIDGGIGQLSLNFQEV